MSESWVRFYVSLSHGALGFYMFVATGVVGVVTFLIGKRWRDRRETRWLVAQLLLWPLLLSGIWFCLAGLFHVGCAATKARTVTCLSNLKQYGTALQMYAQDHDDAFPPAKNWEAALKPYKGPLRCPDVKVGSGYGANRPALGISLSKIEEPSRLVQIFETDAPGPSLVGGKSDLAEKRHGGAPNFLFPDGHASSGNRGTRSELLWKPEKTLMR